MYRHYFYCSMSFRCIIIQDAQSDSGNSGTGGTLWRNPNELSQNTEVIICQHTSRYCFCPVIIGSLHFHNCLEIGICHSDSGTLEINGEKQTFHAGDVTVLPRNVPHTTYSAPGTKSHWSYLFLDPKELFRNLLPASWKNHDLSTDGFPGFRYIFSKESFPHINYLVSHIIHELEEQNPCYQISARSLLCSLYIELYRIESLGGVNPDTAKPDSLEILALQERKKEGEIAENSLVISPALEYIEKNYMQQFSIEYLADLCHWSPTHFRRVFHDIMGTSPLDYVNNTRILKSCILLRSTEHSILDISEMVGFHSVSSFNRYFIKLMQMSPREYRKQMQQSEKKAENQSILEFAGWMRPE